MGRLESRRISSHHHSRWPEYPVGWLTGWNSFGRTSYFARTRSIPVNMAGSTSPSSNADWLLAKALQLRSRLVTILNVPLRVRLLTRAAPLDSVAGRIISLTKQSSWRASGRGNLTIGNNNQREVYHDTRTVGSVS